MLWRTDFGIWTCIWIGIWTCIWIGIWISVWIYILDLHLDLHLNFDPLDSWVSVIQESPVADILQNPPPSTPPIAGVGNGNPTR